MGKRGTQRDAERKGWGRQVCRGGWGAAQREVRAARPPEKKVRPQKAADLILWNHLQKLTDLSANPGVHQTAPENSVQLCTPEWSRVPGEKMPSGKIPGSVLRKQRQTHDRESQGGWMRGNQLPPRLCGHMSCQRKSSTWPQTPAHTKLHFNDPGMRDSLWNYLWSNSKSQLDLDNEVLYWFFHQGPLKHTSLQILLASLRVETFKKFIEV